MYFCCWLLKPCNCIQTIRWTNSNLKHLRTASAYTYRLERVGYRDFLTPIDGNRWVATTFVWLSIGHRLPDANRCQLTNKASIVIDWSINFPIIGFIDCSRPVSINLSGLSLINWTSAVHIRIWRLLLPYNYLWIAFVITFISRMIKFSHLMNIAMKFWRLWYLTVNLWNLFEDKILQHAILLVETS